MSLYYVWIPWAYQYSDIFASVLISLVNLWLNLEWKQGFYLGMNERRRKQWKRIQPEGWKYYWARISWYLELVGDLLSFYLFIFFFLEGYPLLWCGQFAIFTTCVRCSSLQFWSIRHATRREYEITIRGIPPKNVVIMGRQPVTGMALYDEADKILLDFIFLEYLLIYIIPISCFTFFDIIIFS